MAVCRSCGKYVDIFEWPDEEQGNFKPNLCYDCYLQEQQTEADEAEEAENADPNEEYCLPEVRIDPEDDDTPNLDESDNPEEEIPNDEEIPPTVSNEEQSIRDLKRMLFG